MFKVSQILNINPRHYKLHLATTSEDGTNPLDVFIRDRNEWADWQRYRGSKDEWTREYIFTLIKFHNNWIFGGIFKIIGKYQTYYDVELTEQYDSLIGRLIISGVPNNRGRGRSYYLETYFDTFEVNMILQDVYDGQEFPGYENINISFKSLEHIFRIQKSDWKLALSNLKGVYLINDLNTNKKYVGSAYNGQGIWSRWSEYIQNGHGGNKLLKKLMKEKGLQYAKNNYQFSLLEFRSMKTDDVDIINRESFWKRVLNTKGNFGYNDN